MKSSVCSKDSTPACEPRPVAAQREDAGRNTAIMEEAGAVHEVLEDGECLRLLDRGHEIIRVGKNGVHVRQVVRGAREDVHRGDAAPLPGVAHQRGKGEVPAGHYTVPIGKAELRKAGKEVTIVATSIMVHKSLEAAAKPIEEEIDTEVVDLRTIRPIDRETVIESVKKTTRLLCVHEAVKTLGIGAEISAMIAESEAFDYLDAPIMRLGGSESPIPYNPELEKAAVPQVPDIVAGIRKLVEGRR